MRKSHFSEVQIIGILCLAVAAQTVAEIYQQHGVSQGGPPSAGKRRMTDSR